MYKYTEKSKHSDKDRWKIYFFSFCFITVVVEHNKKDNQLYVIIFFQYTFLVTFLTVSHLLRG